MKNIYLTKICKQKYLQDFVYNVLPYNRIDVWKLDEGLKSILTKINENDHIQSLYSKKDDFSKPEIRHESYIKFCYSFNVELILYRDIIPKMIFDFNKNFESKLYYDFHLPRQNPNFSKELEPFGLGCVDDERYFFINSIQISLESDHMQIHQSFWKRIEETLSTIKP